MFFIGVTKLEMLTHTAMAAVCQQCKDMQIESLDTLLPLSKHLPVDGAVIPRKKDIIDVITTFVDRLTKRVHFMPSF